MREIYLLMYDDRPIEAHERFEAANEAMAVYSAEVQGGMRVAVVELI